jgi:Rrf2 family protein
VKNSCRFAVAVHVLTVLAYKDGDYVTSHFLASSVNTNPVVIRRLLLALQKAGLVETRKGMGLGSRLARSAARINLAQVYRAVEERDSFKTPLRKPNRECPVGRCIQNALGHVFNEAEAALLGNLADQTLARILGEVKKCAGESDGKR